jgi:adenylate cyclase class 2
MATETEVKLSVASHAPVRGRLIELGATRRGVVLETNYIFDRHDGTLRGQGCGLRVRVARSLEEDSVRATLTFKGPVKSGPVKSREELEVELSDGAVGAEMLRRLGYDCILEYEKMRETWRMGDCLVELDEPPHVGLFVEIEGPDAATIASTQKALGLADIPHTRASYVRMLSDFCDQQRIGDRRVTLPSLPK